jgi:spermidine/putrescine transport system ATP-binding protein
MKNNEIINVQNVLKVYKSDTHVYALNNVSLIIEKNEFFTLLGPSGCGKTTLLRLIAGFEHPTSGTILLNNEDISLLPPNKRPVNTVFQSYALFPHMTVGGNIAFGLEMLGWSKTEVSKTVDEMLELVKMGELKNRRPSEISGGQQQRVALARALAPKPQVLLLDEPLSALDLKLRKQMQIELKRLQSETGITFVFVTHDQEEALTMSDRVAVMNEGKILQYGKPREIYHHPENKFVANFIGDSNFLTADIQNGSAVLTDGTKLKLPEENKTSTSGRKSILIRPEHVQMSKSIGNKKAFEGKINNIVYFGTDTHFHLELKTGDEFTIRKQNTPNEGKDFEVGTVVELTIDENAIQILSD